MASRKSIETSNSNSTPRYTLFLWSSISILNFFVHKSQITDSCTKKLGMQIELHRNNVYRGVELLLLVSCARQTCPYTLHDREMSVQTYPLTVPTPPRNVTITRVFQDSIELNWLPPTNPYGCVHYIIYYTPEGGTEQSIDTGSDLTHYNLTGLERNRVYTNISVQANNSAGSSVRSAVIAQYNHTPPGEYTLAQDYTCTIVYTFKALIVIYRVCNL